MVLTELPDGEHLVTVRAFDNAGNSMDGSVRVFVDRNPPMGVSVIINNGSTTTRKRAVTLAIFAQDLDSGLDQMCFSPDGTAYTNWEPVDLNKTWMLSPGKGEKMIYVKLKDRAGNEARAASATIIYDVRTQDMPIPFPVFFAIGVAIALVVVEITRRGLKGKREPAAEPSRGLSSTPRNPGIQLPSPKAPPPDPKG
jgi:hypothetical protein